MSSKTYQYLFGPVPSRRLGRSLGIDLTPLKTCTMNCIFCQLGETSIKTVLQREYVPINGVLAELAQWTEGDGQADHITLAGSGEPTLHTGFGDVLQWIKDHTAIPSVLLTNGSLLHLPEVRADACRADIVKVTLSAWDDESFQRIHRPAPGVTFEKLVEGERAFREEFDGELWLEVFIVAGMNSAICQVRKIAAIAETLCPDRIHLNTAVRPPADIAVKAVSPEWLAELAGVFGSKAEVRASFRTKKVSSRKVVGETLLGLIQRHPATAAQLAADFDAPVDQVCEVLKELVSAGVLRVGDRNGETYYFQRLER